MKLRIKKFGIAILIIGISIGSFGFADNYFEISKNLDIFVTLFKELNIYYVDETEPGELIKEGIDGMLESLDPYTTYIPESEMEDHRFAITGKYGGIGSLIRKRGENVIIAEPYENYPAHKAGLIAGDVILEVNGIMIRGNNIITRVMITESQARFVAFQYIKQFFQFEQKFILDYNSQDDELRLKSLQSSANYFSVSRTFPTMFDPSQEKKDRLRPVLNVLDDINITTTCYYLCHSL